MTTQAAVSEQDISASDDDKDTETVEGKIETGTDDEVDEGAKKGAADVDDDSDDEPKGPIIKVEGEDEPPPSPKATRAWAELQKERRALRRENAELKAKLNPPSTTALPKKPEPADFDFDGAKYDAALEQWFEKKRQVVAIEEKKKAEEKAQQESWQESVKSYHDKRDELGAPDFDEKEAVVCGVFTPQQQGALVDAANNSAVVMYALGQRPEKVKQLASIKNLIKLGIAIREFESRLTVSTGKKDSEAPPPPEPKINGGSAPPKGAVDKKLERLRETARKTGNWTPVLQHNRAQKTAGSKK